MLHRLLASIVLLVVSSPTWADDAAGVEFFEKKIRPVLVDQCFKCHSTESGKAKGGLRVDSRANLLKGGENGPALTPGDAAKSRLLLAVSYADPDLQMPPRGKLPEAVLADLKAWVKMGAPWPADAPVKSGAIASGFDLEKRKRDHWSWQPVRPVAPPAVKVDTWSKDPIDLFLLAKLESKGLKPAGAADPKTLLRRLYFDLIGLPPTPEEIDAFSKSLAAQPDSAIAEVVDRLLASSQFGERWGRHWLDLVRYAETRGHEFDYTSPNAYQYRDYVIRALNADVPYNQFVIEHLAGDLVQSPRLSKTSNPFNESILGTGFWFLGEQVHSPVDITQDMADRYDNMLDVATKTFLGLTVSCARCHDHKFDAITTKDYYSLLGFLESSSYRQVPFDVIDQQKKQATVVWKLRELHRKAVQSALASDLKPTLGRLEKILLATLEAKSKKAIEGIDAKELQAWKKAIARAEKNPDDPFHAWAHLMDAASNGKPLADEWRLLTARNNKLAAGNTSLPGDAKIVVDYRKLEPGQWFPDGVGYGPGPVQAGELRVEGSPENPRLRLFDSSAAVRDILASRVQASAGTQSDPGALGKGNRFGRTLCTPKFQVGPGKVFSLIRGNGQVFANVEGHIMVAGPLHGQTMLDIKTGEKWQWVAHDLTRYKGRRVHLEFSSGGDLNIALVVQANKAPAVPPVVFPSLMKTPATDLAKNLAQAYQQLLLEANDRLSAGTLADSPELSRVAGWLVEHRDLVIGDPKPTYVNAARELLSAQEKVLQGLAKESRLAPAILDNSGVDEAVFIRGNYKTPGETAPRRFLEALAGPQGVATKTGSGRLELAQQMTDPAVNPFIGRVIVNRIWHHLFGRGIVSSVDNFGVLGEQPSHPELLDYLAGEFVAKGDPRDSLRSSRGLDWSMKKMIRRIVLTRAYQMSSREDPTVMAIDPKNELLSRQNLRRLEGEAIRDAMLRISGRLDPAMHGPPVPVYLNAFQDGRGKPGSGPLDGNGRRSVYLAVRRNFLSSMLLAFDSPIPFSTVGRRTVSNVPAQALILLNDPFVHQQSALWSKAEQARPGSTDEHVRRMYLAAFCRAPSAEEASACKAFLDSRPETGWNDLAHVLFNTKEFIYLP